MKRNRPGHRVGILRKLGDVLLTDRPEVDEGSVEILLPAGAMQAEVPAAGVPATAASNVDLFPFVERERGKFSNQHGDAVLIIPVPGLITLAPIISGAEHADSVA